MPCEWIQPQGRGGPGKKLSEQPTRRFAFRLCLALGVEHPDHLLRRLTSRQIAEWMAYFTEHPFGQDFSDRQTAQLTCLFANANRKPNTPPAKVADFLPDLKRREQTPEEMKHLLRSIISGGR